MQFLHPTERKPIIQHYTFLEVLILIEEVNSLEGIQYLMDCVYPEKRHYTPSQQVYIAGLIKPKYDELNATGD